jgi:phosphoesterase RecJ-like protein
MDGFVDLVRSIRGVELVLFFKETPEGNVKVSLRSNGNADAFAIARHFGGGGHRITAQCLVGRSPASG